MSDRLSIYMSVDSQSEIAIKKIVAKTLASEKLSRQNHYLLLSTVFANDNISYKVRGQINRILDHIQTRAYNLVVNLSLNIFPAKIINIKYCASQTKQTSIKSLNSG